MVSGFLAPEIEEGLIKVFQDASKLTIRVKGEGMFGSGSDKLSDGFDARIERLAKALADQPGKIVVIGHSDNQPIKTARFPSNQHLSLARAESVMKSMALHTEPGRMTAEGRADTQQLGDANTEEGRAFNNSREGRAENRRIEIILLKAEI